MSQNKHLKTIYQNMTKHLLCTIDCHICQENYDEAQKCILYLQKYVYSFEQKKLLRELIHQNGGCESFRKRISKSGDCDCFYENNLYQHLDRTLFYSFVKSYWYCFCGNDCYKKEKKEEKTLQ